MLLRRRAATAAAATGLGLTRRRSEAEAKPAPHVTGVLVLFRHGARSPVWKLPDEDGQIYETITAAPAHAASVVVHDAVRAWSDKRGLMTTVGWAQGEALGRRLQATYGTPSEPPAVRSTDMMRTVLTAHAVLTGLYAPGADAAGLQIQVEKRTAMHCPLWCEPLAELMASGRAEARRDTGSAHFYAAVQQQAALSGAVRALTPPPPGIAAGSLPPARVTAIGVHDDCQARRFHGKAPSKKNREKRMLEAEKQLAEQTEDKAMAYMHALQAAQQSTKSAHVVLTGVQAIKPNDVKAARHAAMAESGHAEPKRKKAKPAI